MVDNFEQIKELLEFDSEDEFYIASILKRKKEHPELGSNSYVVKTYFIRSKEDLDFYRGEMMWLADYHNARVCINLNRRSFEQVAFQTLRKVADQIMNKDYKSVRKSYSSVCGAHSVEKNKKWIIDIDTLEFNATELIDELRELQPIGDKYIATIPTKNGYHIITKPFNVAEFAKSDWIVDIHRDNPTIIFIP